MEFIYFGAEDSINWIAGASFFPAYLNDFIKSRMKIARKMSSRTAVIQ